jgi:hypothetical protein
VITRPLMKTRSALPHPFAISMLTPLCGTPPHYGVVPVVVQDSTTSLLISQGEADTIRLAAGNQVSAVAKVGLRTGEVAPNSTTGG